MNDFFSLKDQVAVITGANSGLGFRIWTAKEWSDMEPVVARVIFV